MAMNITEAELMKLAQMLVASGMKVKIDPEKVKEYFPQPDTEGSIFSFYVPKAPKGNGVDYATLRKLTSPNYNVFRKLLGV
jgi:hypothetical protein